MSREGTYQIGEVADRVGLSLRTVRYYEEVGLVEPSARTPGGFRLYSDDDIDRLALLKRMKPLGFTLEEMGDLLELRRRLREDDLDEARREAAAGRLAMYATAAAARVDELRRQLQSAEEFCQALRDEALREVTTGRRR